MSGCLAAQPSPAVGYQPAVAMASAGDVWIGTDQVAGGSLGRIPGTTRLWGVGAEPTGTGTSAALIASHG